MRCLRPALLALALLATSGTAHAAAPGVNLVSTKCPVKDATGRVVDTNVQLCDVQEAASIGAKSIRVFVRWAQAEPGDGQLDMGYITKFKRIADEATRLGMKTYFPVLTTPPWARTGSTDNAPPADAARFGRFMGEFASAIKGGGNVFYEVWNEQDAEDGHFFEGGPNVPLYAAMLKASASAIRANDPGATVLFGALTGGNYEFLQKAYEQGAKGSFDGVAVHTDTACLNAPPSFYVRNIGNGLDGRINRFSFLSYREVFETMKANGDAKPIHMTELGWAASEGAPCPPIYKPAPGRLAGVTADQQAAFLREAYRCIANDSFLVTGLWFSQRDFEGAVGPGEEFKKQYGLFGRPALQSFLDVAAGRDGAAAKCGDFEPPTVKPDIQPTFAGPLALYASADDESNLARIKFAIDGQDVPGGTILPSEGLAKGKRVGLDFARARELKDGPHTVTIEAMDERGNVGKVDVAVRKSTTAATDTVTITLEKPTLRKGGKGQVVGYVNKTSANPFSGKVAVEWETKRPKKGKGKGKKKKLAWKKVHGGLKQVKIRSGGKRGKFTFTQKLKFKGAYRVRVVLAKTPPFQATKSDYVTLKRKKAKKKK